MSNWPEARNGQGASGGIDGRNTALVRIYRARRTCVGSTLFHSLMIRHILTSQHESAPLALPRTLAPPVVARAGSGAPREGARGPAPTLSRGFHTRQRWTVFLGVLPAGPTRQLRAELALAVPRRLFLGVPSHPFHVLSLAGCPQMCVKKGPPRPPPPRRKAPPRHPCDRVARRA